MFGCALPLWVDPSGSLFICSDYAWHVSLKVCPSIPPLSPALCFLFLFLFSLSDSIFHLFRFFPSEPKIHREAEAAPAAAAYATGPGKKEEGMKNPAGRSRARWPWFPTNNVGLGLIGLDIPESCMCTYTDGPSRVYSCTYTCTHAHTCTLMHTNVHTYTCTHARITDTHAYTSMDTHAHTNAYTCIHMHKHAHPCTHVQDTHAHPHAPTWTPMHIKAQPQYRAAFTMILIKMSSSPS